ncbi:MAG TPA: ATP-binding protein [Verrucomicrobiae bacterium]|nr:ATP-binding protein [Verrucomicrobiae bacterium]
MNNSLTQSLLEQSVLLFPPEWIKSALVLALITVWMVIVLFAYLNYSMRRPHLSMWIVSWMLYSVYLAASIGLEDAPGTPFLLMASRGCIGISAMFMFWGSFQLTGHKRDQRELALGTIMVVVWSYIAAYKVGDVMWITFPVFLLLSLAGVYTGVLYMRRRRSRGATILGVGFLLWGVHLIGFPLASGSQALMSGAYFTSAILSLLIIVGMVLEDEVNISEQDYRALFDSSGDAIFLLDSTTLGIRETNLAALVFSGLGATDLRNRRFTDLCPDLLPAPAAACDPEMILAHINEPGREFRLLRPDGGLLVFEACASLVHCPQGPVLQVNVHDITQRKRTEESLRETARQLESTLTELREMQKQLIQQERLRALAQMASGVAHDFNNALAKILGFNELLLSWPENLEDKDKVKKYLQMTNTAAQEAVNIVNRLREFYRHRKETEIYQPVNLNEAVREAIELTQPKWKDIGMASGATIHIQTSLQDAVSVSGSPVDLRETVMNLILNSVDAMPDGGTITVTTRAEDETAVLEVRDTGKGMTEEVRQRCFEPLFTTKGEHGTGLGLAIVYGILQRHHGSIQIESEVGKGTCVTVRLPALREADTPVCPTPNLFRALRVLLVEDESQVRDIEAEYLRRDGHSVETAANGREGLEKFRRGRFDLVVADRAMPEMNGDKMTEVIKQSAPATPVMMVTGFADLPLDQAAGNPRPDLIVRKPITQTTLRQAIAQTLAASASPRPAPSPEQAREKSSGT